MRFSCNQQVLAKALNIVSKAVSSRTTVPILKGILLSVDSNGQLVMSASDQDLSIEKSLKVDNAVPGRIVVYAKLFADIIRKLPNAAITVEAEEEKVSIRCASSEFNIVGLDAAEFPAMEMPHDMSNMILFDKDVLKEMIRKTSFAASLDDARGVISGVLVEMQESSMNMVALDGFRMAIARENMKNSQEEQVVIPAKILQEISKIISEAEVEDGAQVRLAIEKNRAIFFIEDVTVVLSLLEGEFVKYRDILPKENRTRVVVDKGDFLDAIERASLLAKVGKNNLIKLDIRENNMEITSKSEEGNVKEDVIVSKEGNDIVIGFNSKYLIDMLKVIDDDQIIMLFNTGISPCLVEPMSGDQFEYLILPVRITN